jgi:hypothetical protein
MNTSKPSPLSNILSELYAYAKNHPGQNARRRLRNGLHIAIRIDPEEPSHPNPAPDNFHLLACRHSSIASRVEMRILIDCLPPEIQPPPDTRLLFQPYAYGPSKGYTLTWRVDPCQP